MMIRVESPITAHTVKYQSEPCVVIARSACCPTTSLTLRAWFPPILEIVAIGEDR